MKKILFIRHFERFSGGHLKVFHYLEHVLHSRIAMPKLLITPKSLRDSSNIFLKYPDLIVDRPEAHDLLFLGGQDWPTVAALNLLQADVPVLSLIQSTSHGNSDSPYRDWLEHFAVRICVGEEVKQALLKTGRVNGPIYAITNGIEPLDHLCVDRSRRPIDVLVAGLKNPALAQAVGDRLRAEKRVIEVLTTHCARAEFLDKLRLTKVAVLLPSLQEGSFLPSLEAMALDVAVVCPETPGIHDFCVHNETALLPDRNADALAGAALTLLNDDGLFTLLRSNGRAIAHHFTLKRERAGFLAVLRQVLRD